MHFNSLKCKLQSKTTQFKVAKDGVRELMKYVEEKEPHG